MRTPYFIALLPLALVACDKGAPVQRFSLDDTSAAELVLTPSPDTTGAAWSVDESGKSIGFGLEGETPFLSLACTITTDRTEPSLTIIRHSQSEPGAKVLFPVLGNGMNSRLNLDATLAKEGWRWQGTYPASAPELDVFTGDRTIQATLPGGGTLDIPGSTLPGEFVNWCRRNGEYQTLLERSAEARQRR